MYVQCYFHVVEPSV